MIWPYLFALVFFCFALGPLFKELVEGFLSFCFFAFVLCFFTCVAFAVGGGFALLIGLAVPKHWTGPEVVQLVSIRDGDGVSGHFFLGTGSIDKTEYYFFYKEVGHGYQPDKVAANGNLMIFEEKRQGGELKVYTQKFVNPSFRWVAMHTGVKKYEFVIPEGSLKKNFVLQ